ncbi:UPF0223 family protein [Edaphobacillus lindanitolerans]|uniref:Uncharacterized protein YktA, UPF0223 family n=1 Tax=Edaphobacillus lindanitolerans TaxID=550447 RepID=A0A1U7PJK0_9BACI|nr:UPF0223 family protein [Edaphobacillus lindanitolerans]SIT68169.1 Uncharacterized protein YktA, UPF0223 family [Edaphobacillus lindanitolerans]
MEYSYPLEPDWTTEEIIGAVKFFESVEKAYEKGIRRDELMDAYRRFKEIEPSKAGEKRIFNEFEEVSGYAPWPVIRQLKDAPDDRIIKGAGA